MTKRLSTVLNVQLSRGALLSFQLCNRVADIHMYEVNVRVKSANISGANVVHMEAPRSPFGMVKRWSVSVACECSSWIRRIYRWRSLPIDKRNSPHLGVACMIEECTSLKLRKYTHGPHSLGCTCYSVSHFERNQRNSSSEKIHFCNKLMCSPRLNLHVGAILCIKKE